MTEILKKTILVTVFSIILILNISGMQPAPADNENLIQERGFKNSALRNSDNNKNIDSAKVEEYLKQGLKHKKEAEKYKNLVEGRAPTFVDENILEYISIYYGPGAGLRFEYDRDESLLRIIDFSKYAKEDYEKAVTAFSKALELDPINKEALHNLAILSMDANEYDKFLDYQKRIIESYPDDKNAHLFLGYGYHKQNNNEKAFTEYEKAKFLMDPYEKAIFESIEHIVPADTVDEYEKMPPLGKSEFIESFWKQKDPLLLSEYNERKLEHYSRVAYANLKFTAEDMELSGWQTDRGMIYIRYGPPKKIIRVRSADLKHDVTEIWYYDEFTFAFEDLYRSGKYTLGARDLFGALLHFPEIAKNIYKKTPETYKPQSEGKKFDFDYYTASFRGNNGRTLLELYYAIPVNELDPGKDKNLMGASLKEGLFFFDDKWNEVDRKISRESIFISQDIDPYEEYYILGKNQLEIEPGEYNLAVEFQDDSSKIFASNRDKIQIDSYPFGKFNISDVILYSDISDAGENLKYMKNELKIVPNPLRLFQKDKFIQIYFEIYNLMINPEQKTKFLVEYKISTESDYVFPDLKSFFSTKGRFLNEKKEEEDITASYEYEGTVPTEIINLSLDMNPAYFGLYELSITVKDLNAQKEITKTAKFGVQRNAINYIF